MHAQDVVETREPGRWPRRWYTWALALALPLIVARLFWRSRKEPGYRAHVRERFGRYATDLTQPVIWVHAVSVGETRAAEPFIRALADAHPQAAFVLTHMTPGGRHAARQVYVALIEQRRLASVYLPYDLPTFVRRFLRRFRPRFGVLWETEVWPNLLAETQAAAVPLALVNARLSERSAARGARLGGLMRDAAARLSLAVAQSEGDARRLRQFGVPRVEVAGNIKFDAEPDAALLALGKQWRAGFGGRPVVVLASTREADGRCEEALLLDAWLVQRMVYPVLVHALIVIVPRHPQRFDAVAKMVGDHGLAFARRSDGMPGPGTEVWLGDSMGELPAYYACADLAFIGGSLLPLGAHNLIEATACGCPVLIGPHSFNFAQAAEDAIAAGAAQRVEDADAMWATTATLLRDDAQRVAMQSAARAFARAHRGATARTLACLGDMRARLTIARD